MITTEYGVLMAQYNQWMNQKIIAVCDELDDATRRADHGAFFGSIHGTLNHLLYGDLAYLSRFTGEPKRVPTLGQIIHDDYAAFRDAREKTDDRLLNWASQLSDAWLREHLSYLSQVDGLERILPRWMMVVHLFNHQTHHRGQLTTLLHQIGRDIGSTDLPFMPRFMTEAQNDLPDNG